MRTAWFMMNEYPLLYLPFLVSAWSPAIASFIVLRKNNEVSSLKEWLKHIFTVKTSVRNYLFVRALLMIYMVSMIVTSGLGSANPIYMFLIWMLASLFAGAGMSTVIPNQTTSGVIITSVVMIVASISAVLINKHRLSGSKSF